MREILFRGKRVDNGEWVYGYYVCLNGKSHRIYTGYAETDCGDYYPDFYEVIPETVGEFTGLHDINETMIFEGDILENGNYIGIVTANTYNCSCCHCVYGFAICDSEGSTIDDIHFVDSEKIGNIHDNPELLKGGV